MNLKKIITKHLFVFSLSTLMILTGTFYFRIDYNNKLSYNSVSATTSSTTNLLININQDEFKEKISNNESFFIYIGRPTCPYCRTFMPKLEEILLETNKPIFYYNTQAPASKKQQIRDFLRSLNVYYVPTILFFDNGNIKFSYNCADNEQIEKFTNKFKGEI